MVMINLWEISRCTTRTQPVHNLCIRFGVNLLKKVRVVVSAFIFSILFTSIVSSSELGEPFDDGSIDGFVANAIITTTTNWAELWQTSRETTPEFIMAHNLKPGDEATLLVFFQNPMVNNGTVSIRCDFVISTPTGEIIADNKDLECMSGELQGPAEDVYIGKVNISFQAPDVSLIFEIAVTDAERGVSIPLRVVAEIAGEKE